MGLTTEAGAVWDQVVALLSPLGVLTRIDGGALARYCDATVRWRAAAKFLAAKGDVYTIKGDTGQIKCVMPWPQVSIYNNLSALIGRLETEFGLTPASRSRIQVQGSADEEKAAVAPPGPSKGRFFPAGPALRIA